MIVIKTSCDVLRNMIRATDDGDSWGNAMGWFFSIAECLYHETAEEIPADWGFRHSPADDSATWHTFKYETGWLLDMYHNELLTDADMLRMGTVLHRYTVLLAKAGKDY